jgi:hypothetical protein
MAKKNRKYLSQILICMALSASGAFADTPAGKENHIFEMPVMAISSVNILEPDVSLPLIWKDDWRFLFTLSLSDDRQYLPITDIHPRLHALELNFDTGSGSTLQNVALGVDLNFRVHQNARISMTYIRLNAHDNYVDALRQCISMDQKASADGSECAVGQLRIQF